jgi:hypothetical protein
MPFWCVSGIAERIVVAIGNHPMMTLFVLGAFGIAGIVAAIWFSMAGSPVQ